jgi:hypothetical protein
VLFGVALLALGVSYLTLREKRLREEFLSLPTHVGGSSHSLKRRLGDLERFISEHPIWHGALRALSERTELRLELALLEERERQEREQLERAERERLESAQLSLERGRMFVQSGDLERALASLREALVYGGPEWAEYSRVAADVAALEASLSEQP